MDMPTSDSFGMKYRFLGGSGLLVSTFGFGCGPFDRDEHVDVAYELLTHAYKHGINFWDTAEFYGRGGSERVTGKVLQRGIENGVWTREDIVISTKLLFGTKEGPNAGGLSRKHLVEGIKASLERLGVDYVDVLSCHRPEQYMSIEEIVRSMNFIINQGWAFYWGTSEWSASDLLEACAIADRLGLIRPIVEQPQYNIHHRSKVEVDYQTLYEKYKLGLTTYSPLAYGILTGKYSQGVPADSRFADPAVLELLEFDQEAVAKTEKLRPIAAELGCTLGQLAIAWCASNTNVSTILLGAKTLKQLDENLQAWHLVAKMTPEIKQKIEEILPFRYKPYERDAFATYRNKYLA
jgi:voltage-dependent potassium channel beta subunit